MSNLDLKNMRVGIIGLGLIGGSLGIILRDLKLFKEIVGLDHNPKHCQDAKELGLVDKIMDLDEIKKSCDVIFLAIPVEGIKSSLKDFENLKENTTIIDMGSTKEEIVNSIPSCIRKNFVAAHPMAGTEFSGPKAAIRELYKNRTVVLCNLEESGEIQREITKIIFKKIGMKIIEMDAKSHDIHASFISHLPHIISYSIGNTVLGQEKPDSILALAAGGFRDMSRLAKSSPKMWNDIFKQNRDNLLYSVNIFKKELEFAEKLIQEKEWEKLEEWMQNANKLHKIKMI